MPDDVVSPMDGSELRRAREVLGLSQSELGVALGIHRATISRWEAGEMNVQQPGILRLALSALASARYLRARKLRIPRLDLGDGTAIVGAQRVHLDGC